MGRGSAPEDPAFSRKEERQGDELLRPESGPEGAGPWSEALALGLACA